MKRWRAVFGIALVISVLVAYAMWSRSGGPAQVEVARVSRGPMTASYTADGVVKGKTANIAPRIAARVEAIPVREGQSVRSGEILLKLDDRDLRAGLSEAEAALRAARAGVKQAEAAMALTRQQVEAREAQTEALLKGCEGNPQAVAASHGGLDQSTADPNDHAGDEATGSLIHKGTCLRGVDTFRGTDV